MTKIPKYQLRKLSIILEGKLGQIIQSNFAVSTNDEVENLDALFGRMKSR